MKPDGYVLYDIGVNMEEGGGAFEAVAWKRTEDIFEKLQEEVGELRAAIQKHKTSDDEADHVRVREEIGDLLFVITNIARHMNVEPEAALKLTNRKFRRRFGYIESQLRERNRKFDDTSLEELEELWQRAKLGT